MSLLPASGQMCAHGRGRLAVGSFGVGTVAHFQQPGQVFTGSEASIHACFDIRRRVGIGPIVCLQVGLPAEQVGQARFLFEQLMLMGADTVLGCDDLRFEVGQPFAPTLQLFLQNGSFLPGNRAFLDLFGVIDLARQGLAGFSETVQFDFLLNQQTARAGHTFLLCLNALLD